MKKKLPTILLGATLSLAMATFTASAFAQGPVEAGAAPRLGELAGPEQARRDPRADRARWAVAAIRQRQQWKHGRRQRRKRRKLRASSRLGAGTGRV